MSHKSSSAGLDHRLTLIVALLSMIGPFSIDTYLPSFPAIEAEFGVNRALLSQSLSLYLAAFGISSLFWGPLADRIGRRAVSLICLGLYLAASVGCALSSDAQQFLLLRVMQGLAASGGFVAGRAMIRDAHDDTDAQRAMAQVMLLFAAAPAIAPMLGGWLDAWFGWRSVFWFLAGFALLLMLLLWRTHETQPVGQRHSFHPLAVARVYAMTLRSGRFVALTLCLSASFGGMFLYIAGAPTVLYDFLGLSGQQFGLQFVPMVSGVMLGSLLAGRLAQRWPIARSVSLGLWLLMLAASGNLLLGRLAEVSVITVIGPLVLYAVGVALLISTLTVLALDCFPRNRGAASAMQGFTQMAGNALVAGLLVPLLHHSPSHFAIGQWLLALAALGLWWIAGRARLEKSR